MQQEIIGNVYESNNSGKFEVVGFVEKRKWDNFYLVRFLETGTEKISGKKMIVKGNVKDEYFKNIYGVACVGAKNGYRNNIRAYTIWNSMIRRCYSDTKSSSFKSYGAKGVKVCDRWLCFEYFCDDLEKIEGYDKEKFNAKELTLDKDIKSKIKGEESYLYCLENCKFTSQSTNSKLQIKKNQKDIIIEIGAEVYLFDSIREACRVLELDSGNVSKVLNKKRNNTYKNIKIFYKEDYNLTGVDYKDFRIFK